MSIGYHTADPAIDKSEIDQMIRALKEQVDFKRAWIPYLAGYSKDWDTEPTIYLDSRLPDVIKVGKKWMHPARYLLVHELTEKAILVLTKGKVHYKIAHSAATGAERAAVEADGFNWDEYTKVLAPYIAAVRKPPFPGAKVPVNLDRQPYIDSGEIWLLDQAA
jgi:hypothetical protein